MKKVNELTLAECREELARRMQIPHPTLWQYTREQLLVERIYELDPTETLETIKVDLK